MLHFCCLCVLVGESIKKMTNINQKTTKIMKKVLLLLVFIPSIIIAEDEIYSRYYPEGTQIVSLIPDKTVLHPKYKQYWSFPDTVIAYKGYAFVCRAYAHCIDSDSTHYAISVDGRFPSIKEKERTGFIVHETDDDLIVQARGGRQRVKGKYLVWCYPPITGYNTDLYLHVTADFNCQNVDECSIKYKMKKKKTKNPFFKIPKAVYKSKDWEKCRTKKVKMMQ